MRPSTVVQAAACLCALVSGLQPAFAGEDAPAVAMTAPLPSVERMPGFAGQGSEAPSLIYSALIVTYARQYGVPVELAAAVVKVESNYNPKARGSAGEVGLMQIKPATARMMGYDGGRMGLFDPETNIKFGMKYLAKAHALSGGFTCGTILRYNAGHAATRMNPVSRRYCGKVQTLLDS